MGRPVWASLEKRGIAILCLSKTPGKSCVPRGLDWRADYHIINDSSEAAAVGRGAAGKTPGTGEPGGLRGEFFRKIIDNLFHGLIHL